MATLTLDRVSKRFGAFTALDKLSLGVADGERIAVFGPSGSGKTVLLRVIAGVHEPEEGQILVDGKRIDGVPPEERGIGMAFQNFALFPHMSAYDNIATPLKARAAGEAEARKGVQAIARLLKIEHVLGHRPKELSNGQKQRTALARALVAQPKLLLLDDPLRNVDAKLRFEMRLELPRLLSGYGSTVLYVTQDYKEAMALGDRIAVMIGGRFVQVDTPEAIYRRPAGVEVARLFGDPVINLIDVRPERAPGRADAGLVAKVGEARLGLGEGSAAEGRPCRLGVRPEAVRFVDAGPGALSVRVEAVTPLNERVVRLLVTKDGREILASSAAHDAGPPAGAEAHVGFDAASLLLFDAGDGALIWRRGPGVGNGAADDRIGP